MDLERRVREQHPDWTDEQVAAEVARLEALQRRGDPPRDDRDAAFARMRRDIDAANERARRAEEALAARDRADAERRGEWERLARQYETERDEARNQLAAERAERRIERAASRRRFYSADEVIALLPRDLDRTNDEAIAEALDRLARERPHLVDSGEPPPPGPSGGPGGGPPSTQPTAEEIRKLARENPAEFNRRFEAGEIPASALGG